MITPKKYKTHTVTKSFPQCQFIIPAFTYSTGKFRPEHQCRFRARDGGFCMRHDPDMMRETLRLRIDRTKQQLEELERKLAVLTPKP